MADMGQISLNIGIITSGIVVAGQDIDKLNEKVRRLNATTESTYAKEMEKINKNISLNLGLLEKANQRIKLSGQLIGATKRTRQEATFDLEILEKELSFKKKVIALELSQDVLDALEFVGTGTPSAGMVEDFARGADPRNRINEIKIVIGLLEALHQYGEKITAENALRTNYLPGSTIKLSEEQREGYRNSLEYADKRLAELDKEIRQEIDERIERQYPTIFSAIETYREIQTKKGEIEKLDSQIATDEANLEKDKQLVEDIVELLDYYEQKKENLGNIGPPDLEFRISPEDQQGLRELPELLKNGGSAALAFAGDLTTMSDVGNSALQNAILLGKEGIEPLTDNFEGVKTAVENGANLFTGLFKVPEAAASELSQDIKQTVDNVDVQVLSLDLEFDLNEIEKALPPELLQRLNEAEVITPELDREIQEAVKRYQELGGEIGNAAEAQIQFTQTSGNTAEKVDELGNKVGVAAENTDELTERTDKASTTLDSLGDLATDFAGNIENAFSSTLTSALSGDFDGIKDIWKRTLDSMFRIFTDFSADIVGKPIKMFFEQVINGKSGAGGSGETPTGDGQDPQSLSTSQKVGVAEQTIVEFFEEECRIAA